MSTRTTIVPAILAKTKEEVTQKLLQAMEFAQEVQVDIVDGHFAEPATWPFGEGRLERAEELSLLPHTERLRIELDLMVMDPDRTLSLWMKTGATRILFHLESATHLETSLKLMREKYGYDKDFMTDSLSVGIAIQQETPLERLEPFLDSVDYVQFMGIKSIGKQAQPFSNDVLNTVKRFRQKHRDMPVQIDGGVSLPVARELLSLGISRLVVGSGIWHTANPREAYSEFVALTEKYGIYE